MRLPKGIWRICEHSERKISTNSNQRRQLRSTRHQFLHVETHFGRKNAVHFDHRFVVRHLGYIGPIGATVVHVVRWEQNLRLYDDFFPRQHARITGENWNGNSYNNYSQFGRTRIIFTFIAPLLQLIASGAFEISINDIPVWSKLETGRIPSPQELFNIIDSHLNINTMSSKVTVQNFHE